MTLRAGIQVLTAAGLCLASVGCRPQTGEKERASFRIIATDAAFEAPDNVPAGLRHILFENRGTEIHESMLVKLAPGMSAEDYVAQVKKGQLFPTGGSDYSGPEPAPFDSLGDALDNHDIRRVVWLRRNFPGVISCSARCRSPPTAKRPIENPRTRTSDDARNRSEGVMKPFLLTFPATRRCTIARKLGQSSRAYL